MTLSRVTLTFAFTQSKAQKNYVDLIIKNIA